jgi:NAD(P)-dependent dehydrogenase (short-subunit alcohol dehydrogenase family)
MIPPLFDLKGKVALITGGNGGIGLGMAEGLASMGCEVCIWGTSIDKNAAALTTLQAYGPQVSALQCDVSDAEAVEASFAQTLATHGRVDGCFANAGIGSRGTAFDAMTNDEWNQILIGTASLAAISGQARGEHYAATKGGLVSMMKALAVEYARYGVTANSILPGWIETDMTQGAMNNERFVANVKQRIPSRRWGQPEDFAGVAVYLMSQASSYHSADTFLVDGGYAAF